VEGVKGRREKGIVGGGKVMSGCEGGVERRGVVEVRVAL